MAKDLFILGSTGSIGISTLKVIKKKKQQFKIKLLTTNNNIKKIIEQAIEFNVKNIVIFDKKKLYKYKSQIKKRKINAYSSIKLALKNNKKKTFLTINAISGLDGLEPSLNIIKHTKNIAIANKESIICGWKFIKKRVENK